MHFIATIREKAIKKAVVLLIFNVFIASASFAGSWNGWIYQDPYPTSVNLFDVRFVTPTKGWITGKYGTILYTKDGGDTWEAQESGTEEDLLRVAFVNEKTGWAAGKQGAIIHTDDGGKTWTTQYNARALLTKIFFLDEKEGWVTGATPIGVVYRTSDSGKIWQKIDTGINRAISSVYFINPQTGWLLAGEEVYRTTDGGKKWEKSKLPISDQSMGPLPPAKFPEELPAPGAHGIPPYNRGEGLGPVWWYGDLAFVNEKQGWAVVNQEYIFHTADGGKTWTAQLDTGAMSFGLSHVSFRDARNGCVSGSTIYCTEDGGKTWQERLGVRPGDGRMLGGISLAGRSGGWVVGNNGLIMTTGDNGRTWTDVQQWNKCGETPYFVDKKTGWLYSPLGFNSLCKTSNGGHTWEKQEIGIKVMNMIFVDNSTGWAVGIIEEWKDGKDSNYSPDLINVWGVIKHTTDGGKTWETQYKESMGKKGFPGLTDISFINSKTGWVVGKGGTILHTKDGGIHWEHQKSGDVKYSLSRVHFIDSKLGYATGAQVTNFWTGIILHTDDGGKQWQVRHRLEGVWLRDLYFKDKKSGWVLGSTEYEEVGVLLHTEDGGKTWSEKEFINTVYGRFAFLDKELGIVYSENGSFFFTTDDGKTWNKRRVPLKKYPWHVSEIFEKRKTE